MCKPITFVLFLLAIVNFSCLRQLKCYDQRLIFKEAPVKSTIQISLVHSAYGVKYSKSDFPNEITCEDLAKPEYMKKEWKNKWNASGKSDLSKVDFHLSDSSVLVLERIGLLENNTIAVLKFKIIGDGKTSLIVTGKDFCEALEVSVYNGSFNIIQEKSGCPEEIK